MAEYSRRPTSSRSTRARSRSPHVNLLSYGPPPERSSASSSSSTAAPSVLQVPRLADFHIDLDDFMNSLLSSPRPSPVSQSRLNALSIVTIAEDHTSTACSVCFEEFILNEASVRNLPCNHIFHEVCIFPWLRINGTCPVCRARIPRGERENETTSSTRDSSRYGNLKPFQSLLENDSIFLVFRRNTALHAISKNTKTCTSS